ncbi:hypothetical protein [Rubritalea profundi]|uniref:Uncharacterized protein n=1 Tax=Rubritalea profundi TaxID=1658618 RepID=A0A2S7U4J7_9BACT|nr:hypothetical protein [Rubritalea profundi]PQJ29939.1 hypothetical protein BSZ32_16595 [Rubritalea profundi]
MNTLQEINDAWSHADRNKIAAILSVIPGVGHLYKHHYVSGLGILIGGNVLTLFITAWLSLATFGLALIVLPAMYIAAVAASAYYLEDFHGKHQILHPWRQEDH